MVLLFRFDRMATMTAEVYDEIVRRLEARGAGAPPGRFYHVAYGPLDRLKVADVWVSAQQFQEFGEKLLPTAEELEVVLWEPDVLEVFNIIRPQGAIVEGPARRLVRFDPPRLKAGQYYEILKRLDEAGLGAPPERLYHVCYREDEQLRILSVWQSEEAPRDFFDRVVGISADLGIREVPRTTLEIEEVHHIIDGSASYP